jgi:hypothetical protein
MSTQNHKRFRAKVANAGFRGQRWEAGDIVEVSPEEAEVIPHHFEELGKADDGSDDKATLEKLQEQEKLDNLKDRKAKESYDQVRPAPAGGPAVAVDVKPEDKMQQMADRKAEEKENDARREELKKNPRRPGVRPEDAAVIARVAEENRVPEPSKHNKK